MITNKTGGNLGFTVSYSMAKDSKHKAAAWTLLSWLAGQQGMKHLDLDRPRAARPAPT